MANWNPRPNDLRPDAPRHPYRGQHAMKGSRKGWTLKRAFNTKAEAAQEADKLNAEESDPAKRLTPYPCRYQDDRTWGGSMHWHNGRDKYRKPPVESTTP